MVVKEGRQSSAAWYAALEHAGSFGRDTRVVSLPLAHSLNISELSAYKVKLHRASQAFCRSQQLTMVSALNT
jgi:hypothetical protein